MILKNLSGTNYMIRNVEPVIEVTGELRPAVGPQGVPVNVYFKAELARLADYPLEDIDGLFPEGIENLSDFHPVKFTKMPEVGKCFYYDHPVWGYGCRSSTVMEILEDE